MADGVEAEGRTVNEATDKALQELGLTRDQVDIEVLSEGRPRLLGFRGEPARVRITPKPVAAPPPSRSQPAQPVADEEDAFDSEDEDLEDEDDEYEDDEEEEDDDDDEEYEEDEMPPELLRAAPRAIAPVTAPEAASPEDIQAAATVLEDLIELVGIEASVTPRPPETAGDGLGLIQSVLDIEGEDLGLLIGRRGLTLASLQYLLNLIVAKQLGKRVAFGVDVDGYRRRREETLISLARRTASRVRNTGRSVTLEPMPANERRIVHITLAEDPNVVTVSIGEGEARKVAVTPVH